MMPLHEMSRIGNSIETDSRLVVPRGWGKGEWRVTALGAGRVSFWRNKTSNIRLW